MDVSWNRKLYPDDWEALAKPLRRSIAHEIKRSTNWACESCGKVCRRPGETLCEFAQRAGVPLADVQAHPKRYELGVAHLDHVPGNCEAPSGRLRQRANLRAWCHPCHYRDDLKQMARKQMLKREREGQLRIDDTWTEGLQLSLLPTQIAPFSVPRQGVAPAEGQVISWPPHQCHNRDRLT